MSYGVLCSFEVVVFCRRHGEILLVILLASVSPCVIFCANSTS